MAQGETLEAAGARLRPGLDAAMRAAVPRPDTGLWRIVHYHLGWCDPDGQPVTVSAGKQVRPLLVLLAAEAAGGSSRTAMPFAVAVELLHNFSLIHDDIEDRSAERRHRSTAWRVWGEPMAINAGDAMHVLARQALRQATDVGLAAEQVLRASAVFDATSLELCRGQHLDMEFEGTPHITSDAYLDMIRAKTAALIGACLELGVLAAGAAAPLAAIARQAGVALGTAFQIHDDYLGIWGDEARIGKSASGDIATRKKSYPIAWALQHADPDRAFASRYATPSDGADTAAIAAWLDRAGARAATRNAAALHRDRGLELLDRAFSENAATLREMALFLTDRDH